MLATPSHSFGKKLLIIVASILIALSIIISRLFYLQISNGDRMLHKSRNNFLRYEPTSPLRGNILDVNGRFLATNRPTTSMYWKGTGNKKLSSEQRKTLASILQIIGFDSTQALDPSFDKAEKLAHKVLLLEDMSFDQLSKIAEQFSNHPNIIIESGFSRFYPHKTLASHTLGYLEQHNFDMIGKMGLEKLYDEVLKGKCGITEKIQNSFGKNLLEKEIERSLAGEDITITIDCALQQIAERLFPENHNGAFILMDSQTGALRALLSRPDFDPNIFLKPLDHETWNNIQENRPFIHRVFNACYPPGSLFKLVTISAIIESNIVSPSSIWCCYGYSKLGSERIGCARKQGHGPLTIPQAMAHSCNILFFEVGKKIDIDLLARYAGHFGLGRPTNSMFKELNGLIPTRAWKRATKGERWWTGETLSAAIGQSFLLVTPIQMARMIASIQTGFLVTPHIIPSEINNTIEQLPIKPETRKFLQDAMQLTASEGTARRLRRFMKDFTIGAKTSTAQTSKLDKREMGKQYREHRWLAVNFIYKNLPPMTMIILVENAELPHLSVEFACNFLKAFKEVMDIRIQKQ